MWYQQKADFGYSTAQRITQPMKDLDVVLAMNFLAIMTIIRHGKKIKRYHGVLEVDFFSFRLQCKSANGF